MTHHKQTYDTYWQSIWKQFSRRVLGMTALIVVILFCLMGIYAPFLASSKPLVVNYDGEWFFPLFRYLFYRGFFTKRLDIFFNLLTLTLPLAFIVFFLLKRRFSVLLFFAVVHAALFIFYIVKTPVDPAADPHLNQLREIALKKHPLPSWDFDLQYMNPYARLNLVLDYQLMLAQNKRLEPYSHFFKGVENGIPTLLEIARNNENQIIQDQTELLKTLKSGSEAYKLAQAKIAYINDRRHWLETQLPKLHFEVMPLIRPFHWEDDAGGGQKLNKYVPWWELTRINRKDLVAALIFGVRISLVVGLLSVAIGLIIGLPIGAFAGYYGGNLDIFVSRMLEIWESMPTFFMLLMVIAILQSKSIFLVITVIGLFGWTGFSRYIRGEFFKQRNLSYVEACRALGFRDSHIMFSHIMPNAIPPVLTLMPFAIMGAITSEAGLSFLGLGEEGSCSWGVLMDEGRTAFPGESYLLWPPAILLTILLIAIALVGDRLRDTLDPKMQS